MNHRQIFAPISFNKMNVGKIIKSTKKKISWEFLLEQQKHHIDLFISRMSGKRVVYLDGYIVSKNYRNSEYYGNYPVKIGKYTIIVFETDNNEFDLRLGELSFSHLETSPKNPIKSTKSLKDIEKKDKIDYKRRQSQKLLEHNKIIQTANLLDLDQEPATNLNPSHSETHIQEPLSPQPRYNPFDDLIEKGQHPILRVSSNINSTKLTALETSSPAYNPNSCDTSPHLLNLFSPGSPKNREIYQAFYSPNS